MTASGQVHIKALSRDFLAGVKRRKNSFATNAIILDIIPRPVISSGGT
jgi:hypothetical protein